MDREIQYRKEIERLTVKRNELKKQNEEMLNLLIEYLKGDYNCGTDQLTIANEKLIGKITGKPIEEVLNA